MELVKSLVIKKLSLRNFRRYDEMVFRFNSNLNTIIGPNAFGKTTVLEAIHFFMNGRSFRTQQINDLVRYEQKNFFLEIDFVKQGVEQTLKYFYNGSERKIIYNSTVFHSNANLLGLIQGVVVTPDDASLIKGSPLLRRHFLDLHIAQTDPLYVHYLTRYAKAMRQRNAILKSRVLATIEIWEEEMAVAASYVVFQRKQAVNALEKLTNKLHYMLTKDNQPLQLEYRKNSFFSEDLNLLKEEFLRQWNKNRMKERDLGISLTGPHRDDLGIKIGEKEARLFASEGQQRSCVMALKLAEWERLYSIAEEKPLMLVDDVGISLDGSRREKLVSHLKSLGQVFLTSTDAEALSL